MTQSHDVVVIGGGVVGLSAAVAMHQRGYDVALVDGKQLQVDAGAVSPRVYAINQASQNLFTSLGVWSILNEKRVAPYRQMFVWDAANSAQLDFESRLIPSDRLGTIVDENNLKSALLQKASDLDITLLANSPLHSLTEEGPSTLLHCGDHELRAKLVIVADGAFSATRKLLNVSVTTWPYHHQAIVATVQTEKMHQDTAYQVFNADGPLAFLPLADKNQCSIVWSTTAKRAAELMDFADEQFNHALTQAFATKLGHCVVVSKRHQFPLHMRHTKRYCGDGWLLMGDAAHTIHPLAGQGLNLGLVDVACWCKLLDEKPGKWTPKNLSQYQRHRKHEVWKMIALMDGLKASFANPLPPVVALRGLGLSLINKFNPLKRLFIEMAD